MNLTSFQTPQLRDSNDNIVQQGSFGKSTAFSNAQNTGWIDYVMNDLQALQNQKANTDLLGNYLRASGGLITGTITSSVATMIKRDVLDNYLALAGGSSVWDNSGAGLALYGKDTTGNEGIFRLNAGSDSGSSILMGKPNGSLTWNSKEVERVDAIDKAGNGYYKTTSGLIIQWGLTAITTGGTAQSVTFPTPFTGTNYKVVTTPRANGNYYSNATVGTNLAFNIRCSSAVSVWWMAIGY